MTSQSPRIYTYKITFEEVPYYYYGVKKEKKYNEEYWGSPVTNKWCWELYTPKKQILELFEFDDGGYIKAQEIEKRLIKPVLKPKKQKFQNSHNCKSFFGSCNYYKNKSCHQLRNNKRNYVCSLNASKSIS